MSERILEIVSEENKKMFFDSSLEEIADLDMRQVIPVPNILGVGDEILTNPDKASEVKLPGAYQCFSIKRLKDIETGRYDNSVWHRYQIKGPEGIERIVEIISNYVDVEEYDRTHHLSDVVYLGIRGLAFLTNRKELQCVFGQKLEHGIKFDLDYYCDGHFDGYRSTDPFDYIRSFTVKGASYIFINEVSLIGKDGPIDVWRGSCALLNVDGEPRRIGSIDNDADIKKNEDGSVTRVSGQEIVKLSGGFQNIMPVQMNDHAYLLQGYKGRIHTYEIQKIGTSEEKLERVKEIGANMPIQANLLRLKSS